MNSQRSETGLNWCSADWGGCTRYFDCGCDGTNSSTSAVITPGTCTNHRRSETESHRCCTHRCTPAVTAGTIQATCTSCVNRASPNAGTGMAGRLTAGTSTPYWRQANGTNHRNYPDMGVLTLLQSCLAITSTWMSYSSRALTGGWMVYLFFYLIILNTGLSTSHSLDASRQVRFFKVVQVCVHFAPTLIHAERLNYMKSTADLGTSGFILDFMRFVHVLL